VAILFQEEYYITNANQTVTRGLLVYSQGTNSNFEVHEKAVGVMLAVEVPSHAAVGQRYRLNILFPSATDGTQVGVPIASMASRVLTVGIKNYLVGDSTSSFGGWYNAGYFGDDDLQNNDVNSAIYASEGIGVPYQFSDVFNSMDVYPPDAERMVGGDGAIRFLDWHVILYRSTRLYSSNWVSAWSSDGVLTNQFIGGNIGNDSTASPDTLAQGDSNAPGSVWARHAVVGAGTVTNVMPGYFYSVPVYVNVQPGASLAGFQFRATVVPQGSAPTPASIEFVAGATPPSHILPGRSANDMVCAWQLGRYPIPLHGSNFVGYIRFPIPASAQSGQCYTVRISKPDGAANMSTQYDLESLSGAAWVLSAAPQAPQMVSDEWKSNFFGGMSGPGIADNADWDGDGFSNYQEYLAGTDPTNALSCLKFSSPASNSGGGIRLRWLTAPGKTYIVERSTAPRGAAWTTITNVVGNGYTGEVIDSGNGAKAQFYRIRIQSP
jgi:hypothetical protein